MAERPAVVSVVGMPGTGKSTTVALLAQRGLTTASEHNSISAELLARRPHDELRTTLTFVLGEYRAALEAMARGHDVIVRDRGLEDTMYVMERLAAIGSVPTELATMCRAESNLLHSDMLILLTAPDEARNDRMSHRGRNEAHALASRRWEAAFGAGYEPWMRSQGIEMRVVQSHGRTPDDVADDVLRHCREVRRRAWPDRRDGRWSGADHSVED